MKNDLALSPFGIDLGEIVSAARVAEEEGFAAVWTYDHISGVCAEADSVLDPWVVLSAIAVASERIGLGPLVLNATARQPAHIAVAAATLQELSSGRLMLGMGAGAGAGPYGTELDMVGIPRRPAAERRQRTEEAVEAIRGMWRGEASLAADYHPLHDARGFRRPSPVPPIIVGANGPKMAALAGRIAEGVNFHWYETDLADLIETSRQASGDRPFSTTVEAPLDNHWMVGAGRSLLTDLEVDRVIYRWKGAMGTQAIVDAATVLGHRGA